MRGFWNTCCTEDAERVKRIFSASGRGGSYDAVNAFRLSYRKRATPDERPSGADTSLSMKAPPFVFRVEELFRIVVQSSYSSLNCPVSCRSRAAIRSKSDSIAAHSSDGLSGSVRDSGVFGRFSAFSPFESPPRNAFLWLSGSPRAHSWTNSARRSLLSCALRASTCFRKRTRFSGAPTTTPSPEYGRVRPGHSVPPRSCSASPPADGKRRGVRSSVICVSRQNFPRAIHN